MKKSWLITLLTLAGTVVGYSAGVVWEGYLKDSKALLFALLGGALGFFCLPLYQWWISGLKELVVESVDVGIPLIDAKLKIKITDSHRIVGWRLFVESATRVTTQTLATDEGIIREALTSLYKLFDIVRSELKSAPPSPVRGGVDYTVESYAIRMLNDGLRQMLSRWHPRLAKWEKTNRPESDWPLAEFCRRDLESTRQILLAYTWGLGEMLRIADLKHLLPAKPQGQKPALVPLADIRTRELETEPRLSDAQRKAGWRLFVELSSRISTQPLDPQNGLIREALTSLYKLFDTARTELKELAPVAGQASLNRTDLDSVESITFSILNRHLRPFLAKWHPRLLAWETANKDEKDKPEDQWPEAATCRKELESMRKAITAETERLANLSNFAVTQPPLS